MPLRRDSLAASYGDRKHPIVIYYSSPLRPLRPLREAIILTWLRLLRG
jgi:hypothetical protein